MDTKLNSKKTYAWITLGSIFLLTACGGGNGSSGSTTSSSQCVTQQCVVYGVYDTALMQSDLYLVKEDGTGTIALTNTPEDEEYEGKTSDGRIIFTRNSSLTTINYDLFIINNDGSNELALAASDDNEIFNFVTTDNKIIFHRTIGGQEDLYIINADGTGLTQLTDTPTDDDEFKAVAPDGRIIFRRLPTTGGNVNIYSILPDGTDEQPLAVSTDYEEYQGVTPDNRVVYSRITGSQTDIYSVNTDGTGLVELAVDPLTENFYHITQQGDVVFSRGFNIFVIDMDGQNEVQLSDTVSNSIADFSAESPAGQFIFQRRQPANTDRDIYIVDADGNNELALANTALVENFHKFSSNGNIIYQTYDDNIPDDPTELYSISPTGGTPVNLTNTPSQPETFIAVTNDGRVIFSRLIGGQQDLIIVNDDGTNEISLADSILPEAYHRTTTNNRVIFQRTDISDSSLHSIRLDGTDGHVLAMPGSPIQFYDIL